MILPQKRHIISFVGNVVVASEVEIKGREAIIKKQRAYQLDKGKWEVVFAQIKRDFGISSARVLLPEDKTYLKLLVLPAANLTRETALSKAQESIPEKIEEGYFDWKHVATDKDNVKIQILVAAKDFLLQVQTAAKKARVNLEAFETPSFAMARLTKQEELPHIAAYADRTGIILAAAQGGHVYESVTINDQNQVESKIKELILFVKERWGLDIKKIVKESMNPIIGLALKEDLRGEDEAVLNLVPPDHESLETKEQGTSGEKTADAVSPSLNKNDQLTKIIIFIFMLAILVMLIIFAKITVFDKSFKSQMITPQVVNNSLADDLSPTTGDLTALPVSSPSAFLRKEYLLLSIEIQNGTGSSSAIAAGVDFLRSKGYANLTVNNSGGTTNENTVVRIKDDKKQFLNQIIIDLKEKYQTTQSGSPLDKTAKFDVVIIIGRK